MAENNMVRNIIDCALVVMVLFFGYHYFASPKAEVNVSANQERFEQEKKPEQNKKVEDVPAEMFELMKK